MIYVINDVHFEEKLTTSPQISEKKGNNIVFLAIQEGIFTQ